MRATVLVTGGGGFVGRGVVPALRRAGHPVRVLSRTRPPAELCDHWAEGDVRDAAALARAAAGCRAVVHLVGIRRQGRDATHEQVVARGTRHAVAAARAAGCRRFVLVSALGAEGGPDTPYMRGKRAAEEAVRSGGVPYTILRPSFVVGPGGFVAEYGELIRRGPAVPVPGDGRYRVQPVARDDLAAAVVAALAREEAANRAYDLPGPEAVTFEAFVDLIMDALGVRRPKVHLPAFLLFPAAAALERLLPRPPVTREELVMLFAGSTGDPGPAVRDLGLRLTPLGEAVRAAVAGLPAGG